MRRDALMVALALILGLAFSHPAEVRALFVQYTQHDRARPRAGSTEAAAAAAVMTVLNTAASPPPHPDQVAASGTDDTGPRRRRLAQALASDAPPPPSPPPTRCPTPPLNLDALERICEHSKQSRGQRDYLSLCQVHTIRQRTCINQETFVVYEEEHGGGGGGSVVPPEEFNVKDVKYWREDGHSLSRGMHSKTSNLTRHVFSRPVQVPAAKRGAFRGRSGYCGRGYRQRRRR